MTLNLLFLTVIACCLYPGIRARSAFKRRQHGISMLKAVHIQRSQHHHHHHHSQLAVSGACGAPSTCEDCVTKKPNGKKCAWNPKDKSPPSVGLSCKTIDDGENVPDGYLQTKAECESDKKSDKQKSAQEKEDTQKEKDAQNKQVCSL